MGAFQPGLEQRGAPGEVVEEGGFADVGAGCELRNPHAIEAAAGVFARDRFRRVEQSGARARLLAFTKAHRAAVLLQPRRRAAPTHGRLAKLRPGCLWPPAPGGEV